MRRLVVTIVVAATLGLAGDAQAAIRWDSYGAMTCWGGPPRAWGPSVGSSGYLAWQPVFVWLPDTPGVGYRYHYGQWRWAYRDSVWRNFTYPYPLHNEQPSPEMYSGTVWVWNSIYDYDTGKYDGSWSYWYEMNPLTGSFYFTGGIACSK